MKTATIASVRVALAFRAEVVSVLAEGESLSEFVEASVRATVRRRRAQAGFVARGLRYRDDALRKGDYILAEDALGKLARRDPARTGRPAERVG